MLSRHPRTRVWGFETCLVSLPLWWKKPHLLPRLRKEIACLILIRAHREAESTIRSPSSSQTPRKDQQPRHATPPRNSRSLSTKLSSRLLSPGTTPQIRSSPPTQTAIPPTLKSFQQPDPNYSTFPRTSTKLSPGWRRWIPMPWNPLDKYNLTRRGFLIKRQGLGGGGGLSAIHCHKRWLDFPFSRYSMYNFQGSKVNVILFARIIASKPITSQMVAGIRRG